MAVQAEGKERGCGLFCPSEVEKIAEATRKSIYDFYGLRVEFSGDGSAWFEIVDGKKRLVAELDKLLVEELYRAILDEAGGKLLGSEQPSVTALYTIKKLRGLSVRWLRAAEEHRRELEKQIDKVRNTLEEWQTAKKRLEELARKLDELARLLNEKCGYDRACREKLWSEHKGTELHDEVERLINRLNHMKICDIHRCRDPPEHMERLRMKLAEAEETVKRLMIVALALSHAWRALTHPSIEGLERLYAVQPGSNGGPLDSFLKREAVEVRG